MLSEAGLAAEVDALEDHELRGVVWANQEDAGAERRGNAEETEDGPQRPHAAPHRPHAAGGGLAPVLSFSHLSHYQDSPCSAERNKKRGPHTSAKGPGSLDSLAKRPARRVLSMSLPAAPALARVPEEGVFPLQSPPQAYDPNLTFEAVHCEVETAANSTVVVPASCHRSAERPGKSLQIPSLLDMRSTKLHYLAMTSAAQRKRRLNSGLVEEGPTVALKRARQEPAAARRPLRVQRAAASDNNRPRRVVRSASEGNLGTLGPPKSRSIFYKTAQQFNKVTKKM